MMMVVDSIVLFLDYQEKILIPTCNLLHSKSPENRYLSYALPYLNISTSYIPKSKIQGLAKIEYLSIICEGKR